MYQEVIIPIYLSDLIPERQEEIKQYIGEIQAAHWDVIPLTEVCLGLKDSIGDDN